MAKGEMAMWVKMALWRAYICMRRHAKVQEMRSALETQISSSCRSKITCQRQHACIYRCNTSKDNGLVN